MYGFGELKIVANICMEKKTLYQMEETVILKRKKNYMKLINNK